MSNQSEPQAQNKPNQGHGTVAVDPIEFKASLAIVQTPVSARGRRLSLGFLLLEYMHRFRTQPEAQLE